VALTGEGDGGGENRDSGKERQPLVLGMWTSGREGVRGRLWSAHVAGTLHEE
jgi:hypothetical protein